MKKGTQQQEDELQARIEELSPTDRADLQRIIDIQLGHIAADKVKKSQRQSQTKVSDNKSNKRKKAKAHKKAKRNNR